MWTIHRGHSKHDPAPDQLIRDLRLVKLTKGDRPWTTPELEELRRTLETIAKELHS